jgi:superfamily II DNA or RNA helicase
MTALDLLRPLTAHNAQHRGWEYVGRVHKLEGEADRVSAEVHGAETYRVTLRVVGRQLRVSCACPYFDDRGSGCKHLWATAVRATEHGWLKDLPAELPVVIDIDDLEDHELLVPSPSSFEARDRHRAHLGRPAPPQRATPPVAVPKPPEWSLALSAVTSSSSRERPASSWLGSQLLYVLTVPPRATLAEVPLILEKLDRKADGGWSKPQPSRLMRSAIAHLPDPDDRWALSLIHGTLPYSWDAGRYGYLAAPLGTAYVKTPVIDLLLHRLCSTGRVRLRHAASHEGDVTLEWDPGEPWRFHLLITRDDGTSETVDLEPGNTVEQERELQTIAYRVDAVLTRGDRRETIHAFALVTDSVAVLGAVAAPFDPAGGFTWAGQLRARGPIVVPAESRRALVESLATSAVEQVQLPDDLQWEERVVTPQFHATISAPDVYTADCEVNLAVEYDGIRVALDGSARLVSADGRVLYRRDQAAEREALVTLRQHGVSELDQYGRGAALVSARKLTALVHALVARKWLVEAEGVRYRAVAAPRIHIRSGIDWFEMDASDDAGVSVDLADLLKAFNTGRRTVTLDDGTVGMLPEAWLARVAPVLALGEAGTDGIRFKPSQVALLDVMLAEQPEVDWDEGFARARERMQRFAGIEPEDPPPTFQGVLREYQRQALGWMRFLREFGFGGCLADDMGLGKTVMVLAMLEGRRLETTRPHRPSLIVLPRSLLFNWMSEAARFAPGLRVLDFAHADRHSAMDTIAHADLVLTTYGTLRRDVPALQQHQFDYVALDEAQAIKNAGTATAKAVRLLRADHRLALTGTPVENHLGELQSLFDFLNPGLLGRGGVLELRRQAGSLETNEHVARLARGLRPFFLRRTKEQVAPELPPRTEETLYCELEGEQRRIYQELRAHYQRVLLKKIDTEGLAKSRFQILEALLRLRQAACHTGLLPGRGGAAQKRSDNDDETAAGSGSGQEAEAGRSRGGTRSGTTVLRSHGVLGHNGEASAKFDLLLPRLAELGAEGRKALVFSQFTSLLALLRQRLDADRVRYEYLDGQTRDREERVTRFQEDTACPLFLISLKAGGVGLNLTAAEYVFLLDPWWNPAVEMQAIDRTHRIGQKNAVFAYRLVARETVEERILELQSRKRALADAILDAGAGGLRGLQREDLEQLLS